MSQVAPPNYQDSFRSWLISKNYSSSTTRNYLSDINSYLEFVKNSNPFSPDTVSLYLKKIDKDSNYSRYLSSLSKFFQFSLDQKIISINPLKKARQPKTVTPSDILNAYQSFLIKKHFSAATIKNYLNDIQQFIDWQQNQIESS
ncbi:Tyrosine recombinase XerC [bioreactor metagenome]|uniref:Tyrosine recombinase XerC n=1 Tax=bioreactor metagenome TaxID=1076179 RepID=A0A645D7U7_9ZZZZ